MKKDYIVCCRICGQQLKRQGMDYYCPTCRLEIPFSELEIEDISEEGRWIEGIENKIDLELAIKRLPIKQQKIAQLLLEGYTWREIKEKRKVGNDTIQETIKGLQEQIAK